MADVALGTVLGSGGIRRIHHVFRPAGTWEAGSGAEAAYRDITIPTVQNVDKTLILFQTDPNSSVGTYVGVRPLTTTTARIGRSSATTGSTGPFYLYVIEYF